MSQWATHTFHSLDCKALHLAEEVLVVDTHNTSHKISHPFRHERDTIKRKVGGSRSHKQDDFHPSTTTKAR